MGYFLHRSAYLPCTSHHNSALNKSDHNCVPFTTLDGYIGRFLPVIYVWKNARRNPSFSAVNQCLCDVTWQSTVTIGWQVLWQVFWQVWRHQNVCRGAWPSLMASDTKFTQLFQLWGLQNWQRVDGRTNTKEQGSSLRSLEWKNPYFTRCQAE